MRFVVMWKRTHQGEDAYRPFFETNDIYEAKDFAMRLAFDETTNVYVQDISDDQEEMRATISTGISVNHLITIFIALLGGGVWNVLGIETLFIVSAVLGLCNSAYAATIKVKKQ